MDELRRLDLIFRRYIRDNKEEGNTTAYAGIVLSKEEICSLLEEENIEGQEKPIEYRLAELETEISERVEATKHPG